MNLPLKAPLSRQGGAALIIVLALVVLLTGLAVAYLSRATSDRQVAHSSFNQSSVDQLAQSAMDNVIGDLRQEITNGSTSTVEPDGTTLYVPTAAANMVPQRSGNATGAPNLIRRSVRSDSIPAPGLSSRASAVNSQDNASANGRFVTSTRWNGHYLVPKGNTATDDASPIPAFTNATPDWVFVTNNGATVITSPDSSVIGRYAYTVHAEGGLLDMNVAGYPTGTTTLQSGRKGSVAFADLSTLGSYGITNGGGDYQIDRLLGWRNYATTNQADVNNNNFPDILPTGKAFARNFQDNPPTAAINYYSYVQNNASGFLGPTPTIAPNGRTDQAFLGRQELIAYRKTPNTNNGTPIANTSQFNVNALQYLSTFSRETNAPSFSPSTPPGSSIDYATLANTATAVNPNFLLRRATSNFTRFDGTTAVVGEPLVKTRFPLSRLAWITYKGPSASLAVTDPVYTALINAGVSATTISAGTAANIKTCFGLTFPTGGTLGSPWTYTNPTGTSAASAIMRLDQVAAAAREPDFFELLQAGILSGSLGQNTAPPPGNSGGGTTGGNVFPDVHMSSTMQHILSIGAAIIDQADPDSIPTRIQFSPDAVKTWTAYGVENLPYITQMYPIAGTSPNDSSKWETCLLFQLWNPHQSAVAVSGNVRLRIDGGIGIFTGGNNQTWTGTANIYSSNITLTSGSFSNPTALATDYIDRNTISTGNGTVGTFAYLPSPAVPTPTP